MPKRRKWEAVPTQGWKVDHWEDEIESAVASNVNSAERRTYTEAYDEAARLLKKGDLPEEIRRTLHRVPDIKEASAEETAEQTKWREVDNRTNRRLSKIRQEGIDEALAGKLPEKTRYLDGS